MKKNKYIAPTIDVMELQGDVMLVGASQVNTITRNPGSMDNNVYITVDGDQMGSKDAGGNNAYAPKWGDIWCDED